MKHIKIKLLVSIVIIFSSMSIYKTGIFCQSEPDVIKLYMGENKIIPVSYPIRIVIANPEIADVGSVTTTEITLVPKNTGKTTLVFWDNFGEQSYQLKVFTENIEEIKERIDSLLAKLDLPGVYTQPVEDENKVILLGRVKTPQDKEKITVALGNLMAKTLDLIGTIEDKSVINIDVQVMELTEDATKTLGLSYPGQITLTELGSAGIAAKSIDAAGTIVGSTTGTSFNNLFSVLNMSRNSFSVTLDFLTQEGKARILSRPRLACQSGKEAELLVGGEKPIFTTQVASAGGTGTDVEYKEYGIKLNIKPIVIDETNMKLSLKVEISEVGAAETIGPTTAPTAKAYPLTKRDISTELFIKDNQTLAIGGLIKQKNEEDVRKVPFLGDIPFLGAAFRKTTTKVGGGQGERGSTELFITLTPTIVAYDKGVSNKTENNIEIIKSEKNSYIKINSEPTQFTPVDAYARIVQERILQNLVYPVTAREAGFEGTVKLKLHISYIGKLLNASLEESSGYAILDGNALLVANSISSYPPFPPSIEQEEIWIEIPITYKLD
jgi:pilus assembly protein CpaC